MTTNSMSEVVHRLRGVALRAGEETTDGQLLECFLGSRDEAAFAALVRRHGPMVWGVCRRVLGSHHDAEDAFQAAFLVLVRKAASVVPREMVANWLHGVAYQTALKARALAARRQGRERQVTDMPEPPAECQELWLDLQALLDRELNGLPARYRAAIVLCDLEGKTRKEAARQLGLPEGTLSGHLTRGRALLAKRLTRRGLALSGGALAAVVAQNAAAGVPAAVVAGTIKAAGVMAAGQAGTTGAVSATVAALLEGVLKTMLLTKLKIATAVLVAAGLLSLAVVGGTVATFAEAREPGDQKPAPPPAAPPGGKEDLKKENQNLREQLLKARDQAAVLEAELQRSRLLAERHARNEARLRQLVEQLRDENAALRKLLKELQDGAKVEGKQGLTQVRFVGPAGMKVWVGDARGQFESKEPAAEAPGRVNLKGGQVHRLKLAGLPKRPGLELFPTLELVPVKSMSAVEFLSHNALPVELTAEDLDRVVKGREVVTRVVYLRNAPEPSDPTTGARAAPTVESLASYQAAGKDVIAEAQRRGEVLAVVRLGNLDRGGN